MPVLSNWALGSARHRSSSEQTPTQSCQQIPPLQFRLRQKAIGPLLRSVYGMHMTGARARTFEQKLVLRLFLLVSNLTILPDVHFLRLAKPKHS